MPLSLQTLVSSHQVLSIPSCKSLESTLLLHFHGLCLTEGSSLLSSVLFPEDVTNSIPQCTGTHSNYNAKVLFAQCKSDHIAMRQLIHAKTYPAHCQIKSKFYNMTYKILHVFFPCLSLDSVSFYISHLLSTH